MKTAITSKIRAAMLAAGQGLKSLEDTITKPQRETARAIAKLEYVGFTIEEAGALRTIINAQGGDFLLVAPQISQMVAMGYVGGEEFRSVLENWPTVLRILAGYWRVDQKLAFERCKRGQVQIDTFMAAIREEIHAG